ncbi:MAG: hypothetical protein ACRDQA_27210 [Nocardioidaceae bacterium]
MAQTDIVPTSALVAGGLVGGFVVAQRTGNRPLGGVVFGLAGAAAAPSWLEHAGPAGTAALAATYVLAMGLSHPLAKRIGRWPSVGAVTGVASAAAYWLSDRHG